MRVTVYTEAEFEHAVKQSFNYSLRRRLALYAVVIAGGAISKKIIIFYLGVSAETFEAMGTTVRQDCFSVIVTQTINID